MNKDALIRARAYAIWEAEGCPAGRDEQHWHQAALDIGGGEAEKAAPETEVPSRGRRSAATTAPALDPAPAGAATSPRRRKSATGEPKTEPAKTEPAKPKARRTKG